MNYVTYHVICIRVCIPTSFSLHLISLSRFYGCSWVFNSFAGSKMKMLSFYNEHVIPPPNQRWTVLISGPLALIEPTMVYLGQCTSRGVFIVVAVTCVVLVVNPTMVLFFINGRKNGLLHNACQP